mgnify:CR=1 FL=1
MNEIKGRFTRYLIVALDNAIYNYWKKTDRYRNLFLLMNDENLQGLEEKGGGETEERVLTCLEQQWESNSWLNSLQKEDLICGLKKLSEYEKKLIFLRVVKNLNYDQIGLILGESEKKVKMNYYYIIRKMRRQRNGI